MKQNGIFDDALHLSLFPYSLTHHATAWYDRLPGNSIHTFDDMMRKFLLKYFPPSVRTKWRNEITKFRQEPNESLFEAWEHFKLSIDTFYNCLTLRHRDTINAAVGGTFMQKKPEESVDGYTQEAAYATTGNHNSGCSSYQPQGDRNMLSYCSNNYLGPPANPRGDVKAITTQSGVAYVGPTIPPTPSPLPKEVERETEATKDKV
nr:reverse transcriptase domain-containing protein [Tanacetum cinerariifolium]